MAVSVYINDLSLHNRIGLGLADSVTGLTKVISSIHDRFQDVKVYYKKNIDKQAIDSQGNCIDILKQTNANLWFHLIGILDKANSINVVEGNAYTCNGIDVSSSSLSFAYDAHQAREQVIVTSILPSSFTHNPLTISKNGSPLHLHNITQKSQVPSIGFTTKDVYDKSSQDKVLDEQTILSDRELFEPTNLKPQKGSKVYKRIGYDEYWYVDSFHKDGDAHLEVFSTNNEYKGKCDIDDVEKFTPNRNKKIKGRKMKL